MKFYVVMVCKRFIILLPISSTDQTVEKQAESLRNISNMYELDKKKWADAICSLKEKIKVNNGNSGRTYVQSYYQY